MNRCLLGEGYDSALEYLKHLIKLDVIEIPSGTQLGSWTVPDEWVIRDGWVKNEDGEKIIDYKKDPLSVVVGSLRIHATVKLDELREHVHFSEDRHDAIPYVFKFYDKDWGFCMPKSKVREKNNDPIAGIKTEDGREFVPKFKDKLPEGEYEVFVDSEYRPGKMKIGVHTIPGESDREILLFAHLDHPFQANDNLSAVACLVDLATKIKSKRTIKIVFCPETIGSIGYAFTQDLSKVDFMIAVDICGNDGMILLQKSFDKDHKINKIAHLAIHNLQQSYQKGEFRSTIGSDEYVFNDPIFKIPGIMLSRFPYPEYHTSDDTPDKINYEKITDIQKVIANIIEYWDNDYIPVKIFKGQLMRSKYGINFLNAQGNLSIDYLIYNIDGKKSLSELAADYGLDFKFTYALFEKMIADGLIKKYEDKRTSTRKGIFKKASRKKH